MTMAWMDGPSGSYITSKLSWTWRLFDHVLSQSVTDSGRLPLMLAKYFDRSRVHIHRTRTQFLCPSPNIYVSGLGVQPTRLCIKEQVKAALLSLYYSRYQKWQGLHNMT
jgi:hypothetical protein